MDFPNSRKPRTSAPMGSFSHPRYAHENSPSRIEVRCPKCRGRAIADRIPLPIDARPGRGPAIPPEPKWKLVCTACSHRADETAFEDLTEPYIQVSARGETLFAWNREHLSMLLRLLRGESVQGDPYESYATYCRGSWLKKGDALAKAIQEFLDQE